MLKYQKVAELVEQQYSQSEQEFAQWMWKYHVPVVAKNTEELAARYGADVDIAVAGAWLHDFGDAFVHRHAEDHDVICRKQSAHGVRVGWVFTRRANTSTAGSYCAPLM